MLGRAPGPVFSEWDFLGLCGANDRRLIVCTPLWRSKSPRTDIYGALDYLRDAFAIISLSGRAVDVESKLVITWA